LKSRHIKLTFLLLGVVGLISFLYFQGSNKSTALNNQNNDNAKVFSEMEKNAVSNFDFLSYTKKAIKDLIPEKGSELSKIIQSSDNSPKDTNLLRKCANKSDENQIPILSAFYYKKLAEAQKNNAYYWATAGRRFFDAQGFVGDESPDRAFFVDQSILCLEQSLKLNPKDLDARADLAANYIESRSEPMKGVGLLRENLQLDSNHIKTILYLGFSSMQSQQFPKAVKRFKRLTEIAPKNPDYHRFLGEAYLQAKDKADARRELILYKSMIKDKRLITDVEKLLQSIDLH